MPCGKTHDKITFTLLPIIGIITYLILNDFIETLIIIILYLFSSLMFNGDLDTNSKPYNRWFILKMIWIPYQLMFKHRSIFTHGIIIGTIIRVIYIGIIPLIYYFLYSDFNFNVENIKISYIIMIFIGLELGSTIHTISDKIF